MYLENEHNIQDTNYTRFLLITQIFGPVMAIAKFSTIEEVIKKAHNTHFGLAAGVITKDVNKAMMMTHGMFIFCHCYN